MADERMTTAAVATTRSGAVALTATLGVAAACWIVAVEQMRGMDMGPATELGSFGFFIGAWVAMMAAMMLPSAAPTVAKRARSGDAVVDVPLFLGAYLAVWTLIGVALYAVYRPHSTLVTGVVVIAAGMYELTPVKVRCRQRCRETTRSGKFAICCVGSSLGLMAMLGAVGIMSIAWMAVIAALVLAQKLLPTKAAVDIPVALAIVVLGIVIVVAPASVPGLMPSM
jgi:predicted metal-binding membrane protein